MLQLLADFFQKKGNLVRTRVKVYIMVKKKINLDKRGW